MTFFRKYNLIKESYTRDQTLLKYTVLKKFKNAIICSLFVVKVGTVFRYNQISAIF